MLIVGEAEIRCRRSAVSDEFAGNMPERLVAHVPAALRPVNAKRQQCLPRHHSVQPVMRVVSVAETNAKLVPLLSTTLPSGLREKRPVRLPLRGETPPN